MKIFPAVLSLSCLALAIVNQLTEHYNQVPFYMGLTIYNYLLYSNDKEE